MCKSPSAFNNITENADDVQFSDLHPGCRLPSPVTCFPKYAIFKLLLSGGLKKEVFGLIQWDVISSPTHGLWESEATRTHSHSLPAPHNSQASQSPFTESLEDFSLEIVVNLVS